ncbi:MAG: TIGR01841 family phasin [Alphaproteobacteria bacterium]|nr:TIGR01841 family phasin [Alphaproteobacteria bacterium]
MAKETNIPPFMEEGFRSFKQFKFPGADMETLLSTHQRNMELMNAAQKITTETTQTVMDLQKQYFKSIFDQWNDEVKNSFSKAPSEEKTAHQTETAKAAIDQTIKHVRDVNDIIAKSNETIIESIQKHFKESLNNSADLAKKSKEKR